MKGDTPEITIRFCGRNNAALNGCITVLQDEQKGLERLHSGFASCTKGHEVTSFAWKFCTMTMPKITSQIICLFSTLLYR